MNRRSRANTPPEVSRAHKIVQNEIETGRMTRQPCEVCGAERVDAHHDDYSQPLLVRWLCRGHHLQHHRARQKP
jgi:ribosomal protein S27AE